MFLLIPIEKSFLVIATVSSCDSYPHHSSDISTRENRERKAQLIIVLLVVREGLCTLASC